MVEAFSDALHRVGGVVLFDVTVLDPSLFGSPHDWFHRNHAIPDLIKGIGFKFSVIRTKCSFFQVLEMELRNAATKLSYHGGRIHTSDLYPENVDLEEHVRGERFHEYVIARLPLVHGLEFECVIVIGEPDARFLGLGGSLVEQLGCFFIGGQVDPVNFVKIGNDEVRELVLAGGLENFLKWLNTNFAWGKE